MTSGEGLSLPGHLIRTVRGSDRILLLYRPGRPDGEIEPVEGELESVRDSDEGWIKLGGCAVKVHSGWRLPKWIAHEPGDRLRERAASGQPLPSRELEFALDAEAGERRIAADHAE